jgi:hypothetical protein
MKELMDQIKTQSKETLLNWVLDYAKRAIMPLWIKYYPGDPRPKAALDAADDWRMGKIKLPQAKKFILDCHAAAREADGNPVAQAAARAISQAASTIHSSSHCLGLPLYGALAVAYEEQGEGAPWSSLEKRAGKECERMLDALLSVSIEAETNPAKIDWNC